MGKVGDNVLRSISFLVYVSFKKKKQTQKWNSDMSFVTFNLEKVMEEIEAIE